MKKIFLLFLILNQGLFASTSRKREREREVPNPKNSFVLICSSWLDIHVPLAKRQLAGLLLGSRQQKRKLSNPNLNPFKRPRNTITLNIKVPCTLALVKSLDIPFNLTIEELKKCLREELREELRNRNKNHTLRIFNEELTKEYITGPLEENQLNHLSSLCLVIKARFPNGYGRISGSTTHVCAINSNGSVYCWGRKQFGKLGQGEKGGLTGFGTKPLLVNLPKKTTMVACGKSHTIALLEDGSVWTWGRNKHGQLGLGDKDRDRATPEEIPLENKKACMISAGFNHTLILLEDGSLYSCGSNDYGILGRKIPRGKVNQKWKPGVIIFPDGNKSKVLMIASGDEHNLALTNKGVYSWGRNDSGQLGRTIEQRIRGQEGKSSPLPSLIAFPNNKVPQCIFAGGESSFASFDDDSYWQWGFNRIVNPPYRVSVRKPRLIESQTPIASYQFGSQYTLYKSGSLTYSGGGLAGAYRKYLPGAILESLVRRSFFPSSDEPDLIPAPAPFPPMGRKIISIFNSSSKSDNLILLLDDSSIWVFGENEQSILGAGKNYEIKQRPIRIL